MIAIRKYLHKHLRLWRIFALLLMLATIVLGILWFRNPHDNYEPLIFVIGTFAALIGIPTLADALAPDPPTAPTITGDEKAIKKGTKDSTNKTVPHTLAAEHIDKNRPKTRKSLRVTFRDGKVCDVSLSASYQVPTPRAPELVARFGTFEQAEARLISIVESFTLAMLERRTLGEARRSRRTLEKAILKSSHAEAARIGFELIGVELREILEVAMNSH